MRARIALGLIVLALTGAATAQTKPPPFAPPTWPTLERFADDAELMEYVRTVQALNRPPRRRPVQPAAPASSAASDDEAIVVTGTRLVRQDFEAISPITTAGAEQLELSATLTTDSLLSELPQAEPSSITNVQTQGVDEGGIVKMIGRFLIILQDGRLFVTDTRPDGAPGLALADRADVYRHADADTWYDEMLVSGNRILVTGYSYDENASEITVFTIDDNGQLTRETAFYITSGDYYDTENYATRLVNGSLVIYTPLNLSYIDTDRPLRAPVIRRWLRDDERRAVTSAGRPMFDAQDIFKPIQPTRAPVVHSISVCPLGDLRSGYELQCETTAFVGPTRREFFVSNADIFLWVSPSPWFDERYSDPCAAIGSGPDRFAAHAALFRIPFDGGSPSALRTRGIPPSQMAMDATETEFRALLTWNSSACDDRDVVELRYFRTPLGALGSRPHDAPRNAYTTLPALQADTLEVRFSATHLVFGGNKGYSDAPPDDDEARTARLTIVPLARPSAAVQLTAPHNILRVDRARERFVITGYRDIRGLSISTLDLGRRPRIADTRVLDGRYESESRTHAFNSLVDADGAGVFGLPTVGGVKEGTRWYWRSEASDLSFLTLAPDGRIARAGELTVSTEAVDSGYRCEVSCVDWYGNTRALFVGRRILGLSATELIEGELVDGRIVERRRLNLSVAP
ncbi:MAG: beta-propeller domain-containing protein [Hyphomonadaceae bacterium]